MGHKVALSLGGTIQPLPNQLSFSHTKDHSDCLKGVWRMSGWRESGGCLKDVWRVTEECLEVVRKVPGGSLQNVWKVSQGFLEGISGGVYCQEIVRRLSGDSFKIVWRVSGMCLDSV